MASKIPPDVPFSKGTPNVSWLLTWFYELGSYSLTMDPSSNLDDALLESVLRLSLEDREERLREERRLGKSRVDASQTTEQYALQLQAAEMETALQSLRDARSARNLSDAVDDDDTPQPGSTPSFDMDNDHFPAFPEQENDPCVACVACGTEIAGQEYMKAPCGHSYDFLCLSGLVQQAVIDEALYPPRCCKLPILPDTFRALIPTGIWEDFEKKSIEYNTPPKEDRRYCSWPTCTGFLGPVQTLEREMACPSCHSLCTSFFPTRRLWKELLAQPWVHNGEPDPLDERTGQSVLSVWIHNPEPRVYICQVPLEDSGEYCGVQYQRQDRALTHVRTHLNYKPFACRGRCGMKKCPDAFTSEVYLEVHIQPVRQECGKCGQSYLRQTIKRHTARCK